MRKILQRVWAGWKARKRDRSNKPNRAQPFPSGGKVRRPRHKRLPGRVVTPELQQRLEKTEYGQGRLEELRAYERKLDAKYASYEPRQAASTPVIKRRRLRVGALLGVL